MSAPRRWGSSQGRAALAAELERGLVLGTTAGTQLGELGAALPAEFHRRRIFELTAPAPHRSCSILKLWEKPLTLTLSRRERGKRGAERYHSTALRIPRPLPRVLVVRQASLYTTPGSYLASLTVLRVNLETTHDFHANVYYHCSPRCRVGFSAASRERRPLPARRRSVKTAR